ncbi:MAG TPA: NUDIX domain-containing protein [Symbiobacteriaceae bacterium]|nr:NUDIX domain-containing protein [Symbiobacteriaceae bacterium]
MSRRYVGAYGVLIQNQAVLLVKKMRGPYEGSLDLPGGGIEHGEHPEDAVRREFWEETGLLVRTVRQLPPFSRVVGDLHHLGFFYEVALVRDTDPLKTEPDGEDAGGALWVPLAELNQHWLSPLATQGTAALR